MNYFGSQHKALPHSEFSLSERGTGCSFCMCGLLIPTILFDVEWKKASCMKRLWHIKYHTVTLYMWILSEATRAPGPRELWPTKFYSFIFSIDGKLNFKLQNRTVHAQSLIWDHPLHICTISHVHAENGQKNGIICWNDCSAVLLNSCMHLYTFALRT